MNASPVQTARHTVLRSLEKLQAELLRLPETDFQNSQLDDVDDMLLIAKAWLSNDDQA